MISTLIKIPYELARLPLVIVDSTLADKLPQTSGPRVTLDRAIGSADKLAGSLLGNRDIARRGADRLERSDKLLTADRIEEQTRSNAAKVASVKKAAADKRAQSRTDTVEQRKKRVVSTADAKKRATQRKAKAELDDARQTKQSAAEARADAERLSDLTEAKKQERKQD